MNAQDVAANFILKNVIFYILFSKNAKAGGPKILTSRAAIQEHYSAEINQRFGGAISSKLLK